jgi:hypothetical protein
VDALLNMMGTREAMEDGMGNGVLEATTDPMCPADPQGCGHYPLCDCGLGPRGTETWASGGVDLDGMRHAAAEDDDHGHHLQADYLRSGAAEIEWLRARIKELEA